MQTIAAEEPMRPAAARAMEALVLVIIAVIDSKENVERKWGRNSLGLRACGLQTAYKDDRLSSQRVTF